MPRRRRSLAGRDVEDVQLVGDVPRHEERHDRPSRPPARPTVATTAAPARRAGSPRPCCVAPVDRGDRRRRPPRVMTSMRTGAGIDRTGCQSARLSACSAAGVRSPRPRRGEGAGARGDGPRVDGEPQRAVATHDGPRVRPEARDERSERPHQQLLGPADDVDAHRDRRRRRVVALELEVDDVRRSPLDAPASRHESRCGTREGSAPSSRRQADAPHVDRRDRELLAPRRDPQHGHQAALDGHVDARAEPFARRGSTGGCPRPSAARRCARSRGRCRARRADRSTRASRSPGTKSSERSVSSSAASAIALRHQARLERARAHVADVDAGAVVLDRRSRGGCRACAPRARWSRSAAFRAPTRASGGSMPWATALRTSCRQGSTSCSAMRRSIVSSAPRVRTMTARPLRRASDSMAVVSRAKMRPTVVCRIVESCFFASATSSRSACSVVWRRTEAASRSSPNAPSDAATSSMRRRAAAGAPQGRGRADEPERFDERGPQIAQRHGRLVRALGPRRECPRARGRSRRTSRAGGRRRPPATRIVAVASSNVRRARRAPSRTRAIEGRLGIEPSAAPARAVRARAASRAPSRGRRAALRGRRAIARPPAARPAPCPSRPPPSRAPRGRGRTSSSARRPPRSPRPSSCGCAGRRCARPRADRRRSRARRRCARVGR